MYKVGLIGCGNIFPMHAASVGLTPEAELAAVCDVKEERASQAGGRYQVPFYTDYKQMIEKEKLDAVHILTPHYLHPQMAIYAASKGVHVLTEKPMSISFEDAEAMVQASECMYSCLPDRTRWNLSMWRSLPTSKARGSEKSWFFMPLRRPVKKVPHH